VVDHSFWGYEGRRSQKRQIVTYNLQIADTDTINLSKLEINYIIGDKDTAFGEEMSGQ
jgi:hypothetical protein